MFAKLLKMEFRSTWNILGILCVSLVGAGLLAALAVWLTTCIISAIDLHDATHGWNEAKNIVISREKQS